MTSSDFHRVTLLLESARQGDPARPATSFRSFTPNSTTSPSAVWPPSPGGGAGQTLQPTALVHEAYLRLVARPGADDPVWAGRREFFAAAAVAMRDILVERARRRASLKRGGGRVRVGTDGAGDLEAEPESSGIDLVALDRAVSRLAERDARKGQIVMLRYFAGLSVEETALAMDLSPATIKREWAFAKALLFDELRHSGTGGPS